MDEARRRRLDDLKRDIRNGSQTTATGMDEARLTKIERKNHCEGHSIRDGDIIDPDEIFYCGPNNADIVELIAEVRRLRALLDENRARWFDGKGPLRSTATWEPENLD
jgi:hypothetical protein